MKLLKVAIIVIVIVALGTGGILWAVYNTASKLINEGIAQLASDDLLAELQDTQVDAGVDETAAELPSMPSQPADTSLVSKQVPEAEKSAPAQQNADAKASKPVKADNKASSSHTENSQSIPVKEQLEVTKIVVSKLSAPEINELKGMAADGVSKEEVAKAKEMIYSKFTQEEINYFLEIYRKYVK